MRAHLRLLVALSCSTALVVLAHTTPVAAQTASPNSVTAETLFNEGRQLMQKRDYAAACPKLAESQRLEPAPGTLINLAECLERNGQTASAWVAFRSAAQLRRARGDTSAAQSLEVHATELESQLFRHTTVVPDASKIEGLVIRRDGMPVTPAEWGVSIPLDPGAHTLAASAPGHKEWTTTIVARAGRGVVQTTVPVLEVLPSATKPAAPPADPGTARPDHGSTMRTVGFVVAGVGLAGLATGVVFGLNAKSRWNEARDRCSNFENDECTDPEAVSIGKTASTSATASTLAFIGGGTALAVGTILVLVAPRAARAARITPSIGPHQASLLIGGTF